MAKKLLETFNLIECPDCGKVFQNMEGSGGILPDHVIIEGLICRKSGEQGTDIGTRKVETKLIQGPRLAQNKRFKL